MILVYTTTPNKREAKKLANLLVREKLVGCVNIWPIESVYFWQGKIEQGKEYALLLKTIRNNLKPIKDFLLQHHPYQAPPIIVITANQASKSYQQWLNSVIKQPK